MPALQAYNLGQSQLMYTVTLSVNTSAGNVSILLNPSTPFALSRDGSMAGNLLIDLTSYQQAAAFSNQVLLIPDAPGTYLNPNRCVQYSHEKAMYTCGVGTDHGTAVAED